MSAKLGIAGLIGLGCIAAAAGGGYLALRSNAADLRPGPAVAEPALPPAQTAASTEEPMPSTSASPEPVVPAIVSARPQQASTPQTRATAPASTPTAPIAAPSNADVPSPTASSVTSTTASGSANAAAPAAPTAQLPPPPPTPPVRYDEVTVATDSVLGLRLDSTISSETARVEDRVTARVLRDVLVDGRVAIPAGARIEGTVTEVERGGKFKDRPRLGITFNTLVLADGTRVAIQTDTIFRDGAAPSDQANAKVGGSAVVGAILGAMIGGKKGALLGGATGAAGGAAAVAAGDRAEAVLTSGTPLTARLGAPVTVLIERHYEN